MAASAGEEKTPRRPKATPITASCTLRTQMLGGGGGGAAAPTPLVVLLLLLLEVVVVVVFGRVPALSTFSNHTPAKPEERQARRTQARPRAALLFWVDCWDLDVGLLLLCPESWTRETPATRRTSAAHCCRLSARLRSRTEKSAVVRIFS